MKITGKVKLVGQTEQVSDKFKKRELVITTNDNPTYPQHISVQCTNDKCVMLDNLSVGTEVSLEINLRGREWMSPKGEVKYFNTIECWKVDIIGSAPTIKSLPAPVVDDLPF
jgi:single-strand DNA-binding protein